MMLKYSKMELTQMAPNTMLVSKAPLYSILSNSGSSANSANYSLTSNQTQWPANIEVLDVITCQTLTTDGTGSLAVQIDGGQPVVLIDKQTASSWVHCNNIS